MEEDATGVSLILGHYFPDKLQLLYWTYPPIHGLTPPLAPRLSCIYIRIPSPE